MHRTLLPVAVFAAVALVSCTNPPVLAPFASDGCSLFPDRSGISADDWCSCCFEHDIAYWKGGTENERRRADQALHACVEASTGSDVLAATMFAGVRTGGSPHYLTWYRWGYGWSYGRGYQPLSEDEERQADSLLAEYLDSGNPRVCAAVGTVPAGSAR